MKKYLFLLLIIAGLSYGKIGQALNFDGVNDRVSTPLQLSTTAFTVSFWMKGQPVGNDAFLIQDTSGTADIALLYISADNAFSYQNQLQTLDVLSGWNYTFDNNWHHIVMVEPYVGSDVDNASMYIDGVLITSKYAGTEQNGGVSNLQIGARIDGSFPYGGIIDDFRVYNRALSAAEVRSLRYGFGIRSGLVGYWRLLGTSLVHEPDSSGNRNHGTVVGGATRGALSPALRFRR